MSVCPSWGGVVREQTLMGGELKLTLGLNHLLGFPFVLCSWEDIAPRVLLEAGGLYGIRKRV